jgi:hypothetical protein
MAHDLNHTNGQLPARRTMIAPPPATPTLSEVEILQRAARHLRLRTGRELSAIKLSAISKTAISLRADS